MYIYIKRSNSEKLKLEWWMPVAGERGKLRVVAQQVWSFSYARWINSTDLLENIVPRLAILYGILKNLLRIDLILNVLTIVKKKIEFRISLIAYISSCSQGFSLSLLLPRLLPAQALEKSYSVSLLWIWISLPDLLLPPSLPHFLLDISIILLMSVLQGCLLRLLQYSLSWHIICTLWKTFLVKNILWIFDVFLLN